MQTDFEFSINGDIHRGGGKPVEYSLLDYLRANAMISGEDFPGRGTCGLCSVLLVDRDARQGAVLRLVNACEMKLPMVAGRAIWTVDGMPGEEETHSLQEALTIAEQLSCNCSVGRCSMDSVGMHENNVKKRMVRPLLPEEGSFFRVTGYLPFPSALKRLLQEQKDPSKANFLSSVSDADLVPEFAYRDPSGNLFYRPANLKGALRLLQAHPGAKIVAGDTLYPDAPQGPSPVTEPPQVVVSLQSVIQLREVCFERGKWQIGGAVTIRSLSDALCGKIPLIARMASRFGSLQVRNRATVGGNLAFAAHDSDLVPVLLALDAEVLISDLSGERKLMLKDFLGGAARGALGRGGILKSVLLECRESNASDQDCGNHLSGFYKVTRRNYNDRAIICGAFVVDINDEGRVTRSRLCYGGVSAHAMRAYAAEELLTGALWGPKVAGRVAIALREAFPAQSDHLAGADYRKAMVSQLWRKFFAENRTPGTYVPVSHEPGYCVPSLETTHGVAEDVQR